MFAYELSGCEFEFRCNHLRILKGKKHPQTKLRLRKSVDMDIYKVGTANQLSKRGSYTDIVMN